MRILPASDPACLPEAVHHIRHGGIVALPTETVYGLAAALMPSAVDRVYALKGRPADKALPWQVDTLERALGAGFSFSQGALSLARHFWPGPLTLLLHRPSQCPAWFAPESSLVALRIPRHPFALDVLRAAGGPLAVTSANHSGESECRDAGAVARTFAGAEDLLVLDAGLSPGGAASTVVDASGPEPRVTREGPISLVEIVRVWERRG